MLVVALAGLTDVGMGPVLDAVTPLTDTLCDGTTPLAGTLCDAAVASEGMVTVDRITVGTHVVIVCTLRKAADVSVLIAPRLLVTGVLLPPVDKAFLSSPSGEDIVEETATEAELSRVELATVTLEAIVATPAADVELVRLVELVNTALGSDVVAIKELVTELPLLLRGQSVTVSGQAYVVINSVENTVFSDKAKAAELTRAAATEKRILIIWI